MKDRKCPGGPLGQRKSHPFHLSEKVGTLLCMCSKDEWIPENVTYTHLEFFPIGISFSTVVVFKSSCMEPRDRSIPPTHTVIGLLCPGMDYPSHCSLQV